MSAPPQPPRGRQDASAHQRAERTRRLAPRALPAVIRAGPLIPPEAAPSFSLVVQVNNYRTLFSGARPSRLPQDIRNQAKFGR
jgi:hypothetical protein